MKVLFSTLALLVVAFAGFLYFNGNFTNSGDNVPIPSDSSQTEPMNEVQTAPQEMSLKVAGFSEGESIPSKFTCDGEDIAPQMEWSGVPEGTESLVLIIEDRDVPKNLRSDLPAQAGGTFVHWILYTIPASERGIAESGRVGSPGLN